MDVQINQKFFNQNYAEHIPCEHSISTIWAFDHIENKYNLYCGKSFLNL